MVIHELINKIANYCIEKYFKWLINGEFNENTIAVFELLECRQKMLYTRSTPYTIINTIINPSSLIGILVHEGLDNILKNSIIISGYTSQFPCLNIMSDVKRKICEKP